MDLISTNQELAHLCEKPTVLEKCSLLNRSIFVVITLSEFYIFKKSIILTIDYYMTAQNRLYSFFDTKIIHTCLSLKYFTYNKVLILQSLLYKKCKRLN